MTTMGAAGTVPSSAPPPMLRAVIGTQLFLAGFALVGFTVLYLTGLARAGDHQTLVGTPVDPKDLIPFGFHAWNPFTWLYDLLVLVVAVGWLPAAASTPVGMAMLLRADVRSRPGRWVPLLVGTVGCAVFVFLLFSPASAELRTWFAD